MIQENEKSKVDTDKCPICLEFPEESQENVAVLLCCSTVSSLRALHSGCADNLFKNNKAELKCPCCRRDGKNGFKFIVLNNEIYKQFVALNKEERKYILGLKDSSPPKITLNNLLSILATSSPQQKDLYFFLLKNNLISQEYFDDSLLPGKMEKLLTDKVSFDAIPAIIEKFLAIGIDVNTISKHGTALHLICRHWIEAKVPAEIILTVIDKFLKANVNVNATNENGWTALHIICRYWLEAKIPPEITIASPSKLPETQIAVKRVAEIKSPSRKETIKNEFLSDLCTVLIKRINNKKVDNAGYCKAKQEVALHLCSKESIQIRGFSFPKRAIRLEAIKKLTSKGYSEFVIDCIVELSTKDNNAVFFVLDEFIKFYLDAQDSIEKLAKLLELIVEKSKSSSLGLDLFSTIYQKSPQHLESSQHLILIIKALNSKAIFTVISSILARSSKIKDSALVKIIVLEWFLENVETLNVPKEKIYQFIVKLLPQLHTEISKIRDDSNQLEISQRGINIMGQLFKLADDLNKQQNSGFWGNDLNTMTSETSNIVGFEFQKNALNNISCDWPETKIPSAITLTIIDKLLEAKINVNAFTDKGWTALHFVCQAWPEVSSEIILTVIAKLLQARADTNAITADIRYGDFTVKGKKALDPSNLITLFNGNTKQPKINIQVAIKYLQQQMNSNETKAVAIVWNWVREKSSRLEEFKAAVIASEDYHYPLMYAQLLRYAAKSFLKDHQEINAGYHRTIELLLTPKINFTLSTEQLQILEEVSAFDKKLLSPQIVLGLKLSFATNIIECDVPKAYACFLQAAKEGWLLGYILLAQQCEQGLGIAKNLDQAIEFQGEVILSPYANANALNKKCFVFVLETLHELSNIKKEIFAFKILGDYYLKLGKITKAIDFFLQIKNKVKEMQHQEQRKELIVNDKLNSLITATDLALGRLFHDSGALVKACHEYHYGLACLTMAKIYINNKSESQFSEAVEYYCQAITTPHQPQAKEALEALITIVPLIQTDEKSYLTVITTLLNFIDLNKRKMITLQIPSLLKLIQALKMEKLFLAGLEPDTHEKFELFPHKFSSKTHFSTDYAYAFCLLAEEGKSDTDICQIIAKEGSKEKIIQFYLQILENKSELPKHLVTKEISNRAEQILEVLKTSLSTQEEPKFLS